MIWAVLVFVWVFVWAPLLLCAHPMAVAPRVGQRGRPHARHGPAMDVTALVLVLVTAALFGWGLVSRRAKRADLTAPIVFVVVGAILAWMGLVETPDGPKAITPSSRSPWSGCSSRMPRACRSSSSDPTWGATFACSASACP